MKENVKVIEFQTSGTCCQLMQVAIDENNVIIEGHGRYKALKELGFKDRAQYTTAMVLIASGILLAFVSFFLIHTITSGVLIYIA